MTATDLGGNAASGSYSVTVDNTAPAVNAAVVSTSATSTPGWIKRADIHRLRERHGRRRDQHRQGERGRRDRRPDGAQPQRLYVELHRGRRDLRLQERQQDGRRRDRRGPSRLLDHRGGEGGERDNHAVLGDRRQHGATVVQTTIANSTTNAAGWIRKSGAYYVYANATDAASGMYTVKANVSTITSGQTALALTACTTGCTVGGVTYAYKSASKTAASTLPAGPASYTLTLVDKANNSSTSAVYAVTADNTAPVFGSAALATVATNVPGYAGQNRAYVVYADASDATSGVYGLTAKVNSFTTGQTVLPLPACVAACSAGGVSHAYASAQLSTNTTLSAGTKTFTVTTTDLAGNAATSPAQSVIVDNTAPTVTITYPTAAYAGGWASGCGTVGVDDVCGTASDASAGVWQVQVSFRQSAAPNLYWDGANGFLSATEVLTGATWASPNWNLPMAAARFINNTGYTIRAVSTDKAGNSASASTSFTFHPSHDRWEDVVATRLSLEQSVPGRSGSVTREGPLAIINEGIGGNTLTREGLHPPPDSPPGLERLERDVLSHRGVSTVILFMGTNDIRRGAGASQVIQAMTTIAQKVKASGARIVGVTIIPRHSVAAGGATTWDSSKTLIRNEVNGWIRTRAPFDAVIDFSKVVNDPADPDLIFPPFNCGDGIHPSPRGTRDGLGHGSLSAQEALTHASEPGVVASISAVCRPGRSAG